MKKVLLVFILLLGVYGISAQQATPTPSVNCNRDPSNVECTTKVTVTLAYIHDSTKAFDLVVAQRDALNQFLAERKLTDAERVAAEQVKKSLEDVISIYGQKDLAYQSLMKVYDQIIKIQGDMIEKLSNQLNRKKGFFDKVLDSIKTAAILLAGVTIGRGL